MCYETDVELNPDWTFRNMSFSTISKAIICCTLILTISKNITQMIPYKKVINLASIKPRKKNIPINLYEAEET